MEDRQPEDAYRTLAGAGEAKLKDRGSVFHALAVPIPAEEEGQQQLAVWRKQHHDATHVGWAWRLAPPPDGQERQSDDGEPHGSTGPPILDAIRGEELWGVLVGVVRWYGGTKLGVGGLMRAYGGAAAEALVVAPKKTVVIAGELEVSAPHDYAGALFRTAERFHATVGEPHYDGQGLTLHLAVPRSRTEQLASELTEATAGRATTRRVR